NHKEGLVVPLGTVDNDYRGEIKVKIYNLGNKIQRIKKGDRIAQLVISAVYYGEKVHITYTNEINKDTERGEKGFGSSGVK
ncbi:hypothetical protein EZS27_038147, partial [termite gut metagenome]